MASASVQAKRPSQLLVSIHQASLLAQQEALQTPVNTKNTWMWQQIVAETNMF